MKSRGQPGLILHSMIHVCVAALLIQDPLHQWPLLVILGLVHWLIDWTKISISQSPSVTGFVADQAAHVMSIILILSMFSNVFTSGPEAMLPLGMLTIAVIYGTVLGIMVLLWVWANTLSEDMIRRHPSIRWARSQMLICSQQAGIALIGALMVGFYWYGPLSCC